MAGIKQAVTKQATASSRANERAPNLRKRPDLVVRRQWFQGRPFWVVKDPVALEYSKLREEEYAILEMLDGHTSLEEIRRRFNDRFAPLQLSSARLQSFLGTLYRSGLLLSGAAGQGDELWRRGRRKRSKNRLRKWTSVLAIRFRGVDPTRLLDWLHPRLRWVFTPACFAVWCLLALAALTLVAVQFDTLQARLPDFQAFFSTRNVMWLAAALAMTKVLHELGHALTCRHFGGECHELGFMLLVFTPCLYCNVSDSWMIRSKWQRVAVAGAGIYVEVFLASVATFLWWFSQPGLLNTLCLNTMFVCSVGTVLFNGNPLLRYDGYYMLSDVVEIPNLWQESRNVVYTWLRRVVLGIDTPRDVRQESGRSSLAAAYGVASMIYRTFVLVAISFFLLDVLEPWGLRAVGEAIIVMVIGGVVVMPVSRAVQTIRSPIARRRVDWLRLTIVSLIVAAMMGVLASVPLPFSVKAPAVLQPRDALHVYVKVPGRIVDAEPARTKVRAGDVVGRLERLDMQRTLHGLMAEVSQTKLQLKNLESLRQSDLRVSELIPSVRERLEGKRRELARRQNDVDRLTLRAPCDGVVIAPPRRPRPAADQGQALSNWWGDPLDAANRGALLETDTLLCLVGDPHHLEAMVYVDQTDVEFVRPGQSVRLLFAALPGQVVTGILEEIAEVDVQSVPGILAESDWMPTRPDSAGRLRPVETLYQVRVRLDTGDMDLAIHSRGRAKIVAAHQSLARRVYRYLRHTFGA